MADSERFELVLTHRERGRLRHAAKVRGISQAELVRRSVDYCISNHVRFPEPEPEPVPDDPPITVAGYEPDTVERTLRARGFRSEDEGAPDE